MNIHDSNKALMIWNSSWITKKSKSITKDNSINRIINNSKAIHILKPYQINCFINMVPDSFVFKVKGKKKKYRKEVRARE